MNNVIENMNYVEKYIKNRTKWSDTIKIDR
jgi:hypothetical protein